MSISSPICPTVHLSYKFVEVTGILTISDALISHPDTNGGISSLDVFYSNTQFLIGQATSSEFVKNVSQSPIKVLEVDPVTYFTFGKANGTYGSNF